MGFDTSLKSNLFVLDFEPERKIIYAPLQGLAFFCGSKEAHEIQSFINNGQPPQSEILFDYLGKIEKEHFIIPKETAAIETVDRLVIILSQRCNMACPYCFAQESRSSRTLKEADLLNAIDFAFCQNGGTKVFTFIGGGEPLITWKLLKKGIKYISSKSEETGLAYSVRIITNGTLIDHEKALFLSNYHVSVSISFDILPDVQDEQRPFHLLKNSSYEAVCKGISFLRNHGVPFGFRSTITRFNVDRMPEMVDYSLRFFPEVSRLHFEPVTTFGLDQEFYRHYVISFIKAFSIGDRANVFVTNSFVNSFFKIKKRFCQGELCLTPNGVLVACHRHSSEDDTLYSAFTIGRVYEQSVMINPAQLSSVTDVWLEKYDECKSCMAKWHCSGKCTSIRHSFSHDENHSHCGFIKDLLTHFIAYILKH